MTTENEILSDELESDAPTEQEPESIEESLLAAFSEHEEPTDELEANNNLQGDKGEDTETPPSSEEASEAAKILAKSKRRGKKVVEAKDLDLAPQKKTEEVTSTEQQAHRLDPPQRFPVEKKEWFNRQPREVQEEVVKGWSEIEGHTNKLWQDLNRELKKRSGVNEILDHYAPTFHARGLTETAAIAELAASFKNLHEDPFKTLDGMLEGMGITPQQLHDYRQQRQGGGQSYQQPQQQQGLLTQEDVARIIQEQFENMQLQAAQQSAVSEVEQLRQELNPDGSYKYPELWDQIERVKPLVEAVRKTQPGISIAEASKRAVNTLRILDGKISGSPSLNGPRLPNQEEIARAKAASVSVRGRGNPAIASVTAAKPGESIEESLKAAFAMHETPH